MKKRQKKWKVLPWEDHSVLKTARPTAIPERALKAEQFKAAAISSKKLCLHLLIVAAFSAIIFIPSLFGKFVFMDHFIVGPYSGQVETTPNFWGDTICNAVMSPLSPTWLKISFAIDTQFFKQSHVWYHVVNIVLHSLTCIYFYLFVFQVSRHWLPLKDREDLAYVIALISTLLLACHPLVSQSVSYISGRAGVLTACNLFLGLNLFLIGLFARQTLWVVVCYLGCLATLIMGMLTSPEGLAMPALLFILTLIMKPHTLTALDWFNEKAGEMGVTLLLAIVLPFTAKLPFSSLVDNNVGTPRLADDLHLASQFKGFLSYYLRCALVPFNLSIEPAPFIASTWWDVGTICGAIIFTLVILALYRYRKQKFVCISLSLLVFGFLPSLLIARNEYGADKRFYIELAGICLLIGYWLSLQWQEKRKTIILFGSLILVVVTAITVKDELSWLSDRSLWTKEANLRVIDPYARAIQPASPYALAMLAQVYVNANQIDKAKSLVQKVISEHPTCQPAVLVLGQIDCKKLRWTDAVNQYAMALGFAYAQMLPNYWKQQATFGYAQALTKMNDFQMTKMILRDVLAYDPLSEDANLWMAQALIATGDPMTALRHLEKAYRKNPLNIATLEAIEQAKINTGVPNMIRQVYKSSLVLGNLLTSPAARLVFAQAALELNNPYVCEQKLATILNGAGVSPDQLAKALYLSSQAEKLLGHTKQADKLLSKAKRIRPTITKDLKIVMVPPEEKETKPSPNRSSSSSKPTVRQAATPSSPNAVPQKPSK